MQIESLDKSKSIDIRDNWIVSPENSPLYITDIVGETFTACWSNYWLLPCGNSQVFVYSPIISERTYVIYWDLNLFESRIVVITDYNDQVEFLLRLTVQQDTAGHSILFTVTGSDLEEQFVALEWTDVVLERMD